MESVFKMFMVLMVIVLVGLGGVFLLGYSCANSGSVGDISETPCVPILSNGNSNHHYRQTQFHCDVKCSPNRGVVDLKCSCVCEAK